MHPVHVQSHGNGEFSSTGISYEDYKRMSTQQHRTKFSGRQSLAPEWALNNEQLREVIVFCMEQRANQHAHQGTYAERLARAQKYLIGSRRPELVARID